MKIGHGVNEGLTLKHPAFDPTVFRIAPDHAGLVMRQVLKQPRVNGAQMGDVEMACERFFMQRRETVGDEIRLCHLACFAVAIRSLGHGCGGFRNCGAASTRRSVPRA